MLVALVGTSATLVAIVLDYWLIGWLVNHHLVKPVVQESRWFTFASRWFRKAPALLIAGSALAPVPFYPVKIMAIAADYPLRRFMAALIVGRLPRFYFLARFLSELDDYAAPRNSTLVWIVLAPGRLQRVADLESSSAGDFRPLIPVASEAQRNGHACAMRHEEWYGEDRRLLSRSTGTRLSAVAQVDAGSDQRASAGADSREQRADFGPGILLIAAAAGSEIAAGESEDQAPQHAVAHMVRSAFDAGHLSRVETSALRPLLPSRRLPTK